MTVSKQSWVGQLVVYGKMGVCRVIDCTMMSFDAADKSEYYVLEPLRDKRSVVYVPCDNAMLMARIRPLLTRAEIDALLAGVSETEVAWVDDRVERASTFRRILGAGDRQQIVRMVHCLLHKRAEKAAAGKRLSGADEAVLQECMRLIEEEFSLTLEIPTEEVAAYIEHRLAM